MPNIKLKDFSTLIFCIGLISCTKNDNVAGGVVDTGNSIELSGRVLDKSNKPAEGIIVTLAKKGLSDTTGNDGRYLIEGELDEAETKNEVLDTLVFLQKDLKVAELNVTKWIDTLPDVKIIQRDISGELENSDVKIGEIEAVLFGDGVPEDQPVTKRLGYLEETRRYSGFVYFPVTSDKQNYSVFINVYDNEGKLTGRSDTISFDSDFGDLVLPVINPENALPSADAGKDTTVSINDTIFLTGSAEDAFDGIIEKWEWNISGNGFIGTSTSDTSIIAPEIEDISYPCILRVTDNDGNIAYDTVIIKVLADLPIADAGKDIFLLPFDIQPVKLNGEGSFDNFGTIDIFEWDIGNTGVFTPSSKSDTTITIDTLLIPYECILRVTDDDGNYSTDTVNIDVGFEFEQITGNADFKARAGHSSINFNDKIWVIGGTTSGTSNNYIKKEVWNSENGRNWELVSTLPDVYPGGTNSAVVFKNKMWIIGTRDYENNISKSQVINSSDGISWNLLTDSAEFSPRNHHSVTVFDNKVWVIGGDAETGANLNDVWFSNNGITWNLVTNSAAFPERYGHLCVEFNGKLWIIGGGDGSKNDIWHSQNGNEWFEVQNTQAFEGRFQATGIVWKNKLWIIGGDGGNSNKFNDVWYSSDGILWDKATTNAQFGKRSYLSSVIFNSTMWIIGGIGDAENNYDRYNDVWFLK